MMAEWTCEGIGVADEGDCYTTEDDEWEVRNVIGSAQDEENMTEFWQDHAGEGGRRIALRNQTCGKDGCPNRAEEGGHVWLRRVGARNRLRAFCFIMPICRSCNREEENEVNFFEINQGVRLVAREVLDGMR